MKVLKIIFLIVFLGLVVTLPFMLKKEASEYKDITVADLKQHIDEEKDIYLLDVHTPEQEHISGTDAFIPFTDLKENQNTLPKDKGTEIVVYCRSGSMSETASETLVGLGYTNVQNVLGGVNAWKAEGYDKVNYNKPLAETHSDVHDFGQITREAGIVSTTFEIENHGKETLILGEISTSCSCTSAKVEKTELGFDEESTLTVYFDPNVHEEPDGQFTRSVFVPTNDPDLPEMQFDIKVEIIN